jgi:hypothetical protein
MRGMTRDCQKSPPGGRREMAGMLQINHNARGLRLRQIDSFTPASGIPLPPSFEHCHGVPLSLERINKLKPKENCRYGRLTWHKQTMQVGHTCPTSGRRTCVLAWRTAHVGQVCPTYGPVWASICLDY